MNNPGKRFNPFPGLRSFEPEEVDLFFGRDTQIDELLQRLQRSRFLAVLGSSGSGKSSLVRAGLIPALQSGFMTDAGSSWRIAVFKPGNDPIGNLARELVSPDVFGLAASSEFAGSQAMIMEMNLRHSRKGLADVAQQHHLAADENLLIVVDQFEELFRFRQTMQTENKREDAILFSQMLINASQVQAPSIYVVLTMRSDFVGDCSELPDLAEAINEGMYLIPRMTRQEQRAAITGPVGVGGATIAPRLVMTLLNSIGNNQDMLPVLQHALMRTWDYWAGHHQDHEPIDLEHYQFVGGLENALDLHAEEAFRSLPNRRSQEIAEILFKGLTHLEKDNRGVRRPTELSEICKISAATIDEVMEVVECFRKTGRSFLMPPPDVPLTENTILDISHESLMRIWKRLIQWVTEESNSAQMYIELAKTAADNQAGKKAFLIDPELHLYLNWRNRVKPTEAWAKRYDPSFTRARLYLENSHADHLQKIENEKKVQKRKVRNARLIIAALLIGLLSVGYLAFQYYSQKRELEETQGQLGDARNEIQTAQNELDETKDAIEQAQKEADSLKQATEDFQADAKVYQKQANDAKKYAEHLKQLAQEAEKTMQQLQKQAYNDSVLAANLKKQTQDLEAAKKVLNDENTILNEKNAARRLAIQAVRVQDPELSLLLASKAYGLYSKHDTSNYVPTIYEALWTGFQRNSPDENRIKVHNEDVRAAIFFNAAGNSHLLTTSDDGKARFWEMQSVFSHLKLVGDENLKRVNGIRTLNWQSSHDLLAIGSDSGQVLLGSAEKFPRALEEITQHQRSIHSLRFAPDNNLLVCGSLDGQVSVYDLTKNRIVKKIKFETRIHQIDFHPLLPEVIMAAGDDGKVHYWNFVNDKTWPEEISSKGRLLTIASNAHRKLIAVGLHTGMIEVRDFNAGPQVSNFCYVLQGHRSGVTSLDFAAKQPILISGSYDRTVRIWDLEHADAEAITLDEATDWIRTVTLTPDEKQVLAGAADGTLYAWPTNCAIVAEKSKPMVKRELTEAELKIYLGEKVQH